MYRVETKIGGLMAIVAGVFVAYAGFSAVAVLVGFDEDDRLIAGAVWRRIRTTFGGALA